MAVSERKGLAVLLSLLLQICLAVDRSVFELIPSSYLSGVTGDVQFRCHPPASEDIAKVLTLQVFKQRNPGPVLDPLATYVTTESPVLEALGVSLNASGAYNAAQPKSALLSVYLPHPTDAAAGRYRCRVVTQDSRGLLHTYVSYSTLTSLAKNGTVPVFYQTILRDFRKELDILTSHLENVTNTQLFVRHGDNEEQAKLTGIETDAGQINSMVGDSNTYLHDVNQTVTSLQSEVIRLRDVTPAVPVNFYAYMSSYHTSPSNNANIVFNVLEQHTDNSYSKSTGVFTAPAEGTYYFRTGITGNAAPTSASIIVNDLPVVSLIGKDDYNVKQATASVVVKLKTNDEVRVVKRSGSYIYGYYPSSGAMTHISYFMGMFLW